MKLQLKGKRNYITGADIINFYKSKFLKKTKIVFNFYKLKGFELTQLKTVGGKLGCNEYVFRRKQISKSC